MSEATAVRVAIDLLRVPSRVRSIRDAPLPDGMELLLRIAAGERAAIDTAVGQTERSETVLRQAAEFFIEQILLSPQSQSYRVLGANCDAPSTELRRNMALLVRWMHPDVAESVNRSVFAGRVTLAWDNLKTADRRAAYDKAIDGALHAGSSTKQTSTRSARTSKLRQLRLGGATRDSATRGDLASRLHASNHDRVEQPGLLRRAWLLMFRRLRG